MTTTPRNLEEVPTIQSSQAEVWYLKPIAYRGKHLQIITQNFNGPCSFIAICNILILRENIQILPPTRTTVSYEHLSQLVAEYLLVHSPDVDISDALSIMPHTQKGLDLNPLFTSPTAFHPATDTAGAELKLFAQAGIHLVHGWLVDPGSDEAFALEREGIKDYDSAVAFIAEADFLGGGIVVGGESERGLNGNGNREWTDEEKRKIKNALTIRHFLESSQSQLTYHGLFHLASELPSGSLVALFRNSHLGVLLKGGQEKPHPQEEPAHARFERVPSTSSNGAGVDYHGATRSSAQASSSTSEPQHDTASSSQNNIPSNTTIPTGQTHPSSLGVPSHTQDTEASLVSDISALSLDAKTSLGSTQDPFIITQTVQAGSTPVLHEHNPSPTTGVPQDTALYTLVTDQVFLQEPSVVWERIEDVDGAAGEFVDGEFLKSSPAGGDWAGRTAEEAAQAFQDAEDAASRAARGIVAGVGDPSDLELAQRLQAEEDHYARRAEERYLQEQERRRFEQDRSQKILEQRRTATRKKEKKDCIIM
ncbi:hypothetical protein BDZ94DRAFT_1292294 [Collybia nuda]|uniref:MINDY deubiquitinase domain-containing protein n=1 Tax=Collybia nuda TaxID=64659 RepID=A0A9P6CD51_9AGAR|nr:hypothetical protein BDZ94DRAFT_1292294 [Collybia nuda]